LTLPSELYNNFIAFVSSVIKTNSNDIIIQAIDQKLKAEKELLQLNLLQGYQVTKNEDLKLVKEFKILDFETIK